MGASVTLWEATAPVKLPAWPCLVAGSTVRRLDTSPRKSGISPLPPHRPQAMAHRLPPILRRRGLAPRPGCSKAPRGLFVLSWVTRIFTGTSISPSPLSRQCSSRYSFRAGRNLPDKEFRYLRTVIVTAAVHRGFSSELRTPLPLTFRHWAGVSPYTSAFAVAETCVFGKQSLEPASCGPLTLGRTCLPTLPGHPFSRSYGVNLPSSLTEDRSSTLGCLPLPTCVGLRYGPPCHSYRARGFSWRPGRPVTSVPSAATRARFWCCWPTGFPWRPTSGTATDPVHSAGSPSLPRPPFALRRHGRRTVYLLSIAYAATSLGLGPD